MGCYHIRVYPSQGLLAPAWALRGTLPGPARWHRWGTPGTAAPGRTSAACLQPAGPGGIWDLQEPVTPKPFGMQWCCGLTQRSSTTTTPNSAPQACDQLTAAETSPSSCAKSRHSLMGCDKHRYVKQGSEGAAGLVRRAVHRGLSRAGSCSTGITGAISMRSSQLPDLPKGTTSTGRKTPQSLRRPGATYLQPRLSHRKTREAKLNTARKQETKPNRRLPKPSNEGERRT